MTKDSEEPIEIIFVSSDNSPEELMAYMNEVHGDWLAVQHGAVLAEYIDFDTKVETFEFLVKISVGNLTQSQ